jgi:hypothetical protein
MIRHTALQCKKVFGARPQPSQLALHGTSRLLDNKYSNLKLLYIFEDSIP